jgi:hypothetical protein
LEAKSDEGDFLGFLYQQTTDLSLITLHSIILALVLLYYKTSIGNF